MYSSSLRCSVASATSLSRAATPASSALISSVELTQLTMYSVLCWLCQC